MIEYRMQWSRMLCAKMLWVIYKDAQCYPQERKREARDRERERERDYYYLFIYIF